MFSLKIKNNMLFRVAKQRSIYVLCFIIPFILALYATFQDSPDRLMKCLICTLGFSLLFSANVENWHDIIIPLLCGVTYYIGSAGTFYLYSTSAHASWIEVQYELFFAELLAVILISLYRCIGNRFYIITILEFIILLMAFAYMVYYAICGISINSDTIFILLQTNQLEAIRFITNEWLSVLGICIIMISVLYVIGRYNHKFCKSNKFSILSLIILSLAVGLNYFVVFRDAHLYLHRDFNIAYGYFCQIKKMQDNQQKLKSYVTSNNIKNIVLVIGESANRDYMGVYGYERNNTPWLSEISKDSNTVVFDKVYTSYRLTNKALAYFLTEKNQYNDENLYDAVNLIDIMKAAGYKTYWFSTQGNASNFREVYNVIAQRSDYTNFKDGAYDEKLVDCIDIPADETKKFIVFHLSGSHHPYKHYPPEFNEYGTDTISDNYDNSILYTDYVLKSIFEKVSQYKPDLFIYTSDHGESKEMTRVKFDYRMSHVPFVIWFSDKCKNSIPAKYNIAIARKHTYFTHDMFYETMLDIIGMDTSQYDSHKSLLSDDYKFDKNDLLTEYGSKKIKDDPYDEIVQ